MEKKINYMILNNKNVGISKIELNKDELNITDKTGDIVSFEIIPSGCDKDVMLVTNEGIIIRIDVSQISTMSRVTQGVKLINLKEEQFVSSVTIIDKLEECED